MSSQEQLRKVLKNELYKDQCGSIKTCKQLEEIENTISTILSNTVDRVDDIVVATNEIINSPDFATLNAISPVS